MGQLLVDYALSYALTATADVLAVDKPEITYIVDMFCATLKLPVETPEKPFIALETLQYIQPFLKIVGYQGIVDKVSAFFTKKLAQPWQTMFKVFNRCLTSRISGHDQTKINILQIFHVVVNRLIIADLMQKFDTIPNRLEEDYHSIKDDFLLVSVYTIGNVTVKGMLILDEFLTDNIHATPKYKEYVKVFVEVDIPTIQPQPFESTQGSNRTPRAIRTPNPAEDIVQKKKRKQVAGETSSPRKSRKVTIKQVKPSTTPIAPPSDDKERDEIAEATLLSFALHKTAKIVEEQENVAKVQEKILEEDVEKIVEGEDEESYASEFVDYVFLNDEEDSDTMLEPRSHKKNTEIVYDDDDEEEKKDDNDNDDNNDDDNYDHDDHALVRNKVTGSSEIRKEKMQTPIPSPTRSFRTYLFSDKLRESLDSDYAGANLDRKSTTGGCQFLGRRLIS
ncbi:hypothetical protein Tco_0363657 [Tanacetum coccineum]